MTIDNLFSLIGLIFGIPGFIVSFFEEKRWRTILFAVVIFSLGLSVVVIKYDGHQHNQRIKEISRQLNNKLGNNALTIDELYASFNGFQNVSPAELNEALSVSIKDGKIKDIENRYVFDYNGINSFQMIRRYYVVN
jgi:hypothetical protein